MSPYLFTSLTPEMFLTVSASHIYDKISIQRGFYTNRKSEFHFCKQETECFNYNVSDFFLPHVPHTIMYIPLVYYKQSTYNYVSFEKYIQQNLP